ncbi:4-hydroxy-tetrahydrodipicolinate reductase [Buchnera aphidicola (Tetraneura ulmi)]|uniref:4-hydroxy-tetrahydrodipicolinate reductase n=1 Tax=Buchnera aphidicola TaxID=9 RepID=UPI0034642E84
MNNKIIKIAISGALGRMGRILIKQLINNYNSKAILTTVISSRNKKYIGKDIRNILKLDSTNINICSDFELSKKNFDVLIDFTHPKKTMEYIDFCKKNKKKIVIGTTGFNKKEELKIKNVSKEIGVVLSSNFSTGINILIKIIKDITKIIGKKSEVKIIEYHHNKKIDSPSGTALTLKKVINETFYKKYQEIKNIDISSIRMGDISGEHSIFFSFLGEYLEITHKSINRKIFANGAIDAAIWLQSKKTGLFNMQEVLDIK